MLNLVIVEDDILITELILSIIDSSCTDIKVKGVASNLNTALQMISEKSPDLVLFDIDFLGGISFDIIQKFNPINFKIIFITAYDRYAIQAIKLSALDYLLKPVNSEELVRSFEKAKRIVKNEEDNTQPGAFRNNINYTVNDPERIVLKTLESIYFVDIKDIIRCESGGSYTYFYLQSGKKITTSRLLKEYDELLQDHGFIRVHQSHLINISYIDRFDKKNGGMLIMKDGSGVPVSFRKKESFFKLIGNF